MDDLTYEKYLKLTKRYPSRIPVFVQVSKGNDLCLRKNRFLVPREFTTGQLMLCVRRHCGNIEDTEGLYMLAGGKMWPASTTVGLVWTRARDEKTQFLKVDVSKENTFG